MMKKIILILFLLLTSISIILAQVRVKGYYRKNGTYVQPHYRSSPDRNPYNNYSYPGNTNPYTGKVAPGKSSTYLNNYYKKNSEGGYLNKRYYSLNNYSLLTNNYSFIGNIDTRSLEYNIVNLESSNLGKILTKDLKLYEIYDENSIHIGYVKLRKNGSYKIYDTNFQRIKNANTTNTKKSFAIGYLAIIALTTLLLLK